AIELIAAAAPKRDYYYVSPLGRRLFRFALGPAALAFVGAGTKDDVLIARRLIAEHGARWPAAWLRLRGQPEWAAYLDGLHQPITKVPPAAITSYRNGHYAGRHGHEDDETHALRRGRT